MNLEFIFLNERIRIRIRISDSLFDSAPRAIKNPVTLKQFNILSIANNGKYG